MRMTGREREENDGKAEGWRWGTGRGQRDEDEGNGEGWRWGGGVRDEDEGPGEGWRMGEGVRQKWELPRWYLNIHFRCIIKHLPPTSHQDLYALAIAISLSIYLISSLSLALCIYLNQFWSPSPFLSPSLLFSSDTKTAFIQNVL